METSPSLVISQDDFQKITALLSIAKFEIATLLEEELERAQIVPPAQLLPDIIAMNSQITFIDLDTKKEQVVTLVYPHDADVNAHKISILAPVGAALIGLRVGQTIDWPLNDKKVKRIQVTGVVHAGNGVKL
ncbi:MAG: nucleoside diphosphate kinase regulator [Bdellovibrionaceae bacterium]|nr:nucleoside diphosphate kinase regulator [Pseudobdellovibrionaceae bacterium]